MEFQPEKESWDTYVERLEHFFKAANIVDDEKKLFTLIHQNGPSLYTLLKELSFPNNPTLMSYSHVMGLLKQHYVGAKSVFYERKVFFRAQMKPYESASDWHRRLKGLVINCEFGGFLEEILVDKFVTGFQGKVLHRLYEQDATLTLQQALELAQRYENDSNSEGKIKECKTRERSESRQRSQKHHVQGHQQQQQYNYQQQVNQQQQSQRQQPHQQHQKQPRHQQQVSQGQVHQQQQQQRQQPPKQNQNQHVPGEQRQPRQQQQIERNVPTCYKCGKRGHYANVCRSKIAPEEKSDCCIS